MPAVGTKDIVWPYRGAALLADHGRSCGQRRATGSAEPRARSGLPTALGTDQRSLPLLLTSPDGSSSIRSPLVHHRGTPDRLWRLGALSGRSGGLRARIHRSGTGPRNGRGPRSRHASRRCPLPGMNLNDQQDAAKHDQPRATEAQSAEQQPQKQQRAPAPVALTTNRPWSDIRDRRWRRHRSGGGGREIRHSSRTRRWQHDPRHRRRRQSKPPVSISGVRACRAEIHSLLEQVVDHLLTRHLGIGLPHQRRGPGDVRGGRRGAVEPMPSIGDACHARRS